MRGLQAELLIAYATLKKHYARWLPNRDRVELQRFTSAIEAEVRSAG